MNQLVPINDNIVVKRLQPMYVGKIHIPQETLQKHFYASIVSVGNKVKDKYLQPNIIIFVTPTSSDIQRYGDYNVVKEKDIIAIRCNNIIRAFGNRILIKRLNQEEKIGSVIIPDCHNTADQTLEGIFISRGVINGSPIEIPILPGDIVRIEKWNMHIIEIDIDGEYYLSVRVKDIAYVKHA